MILIADGGSTKVDWIAINSNKEEEFRVRTLGLNPAIIQKEDLHSRVINMFQLFSNKEEIEEIHFYGAGCGTAKPAMILEGVLKSIFTNAKIFIAEDMLAAVYSASSGSPAVVCIIGTGSNSCYYNGSKMEMLVPSLGYILMDEASGNYFGKKLIIDYYYKKMPKKISKEFGSKFELDADHIKKNLYREPNPNMYLASFAKFMLEFKENKYIKKTIRKGFQKFFKYRILPYNKTSKTPIYFVGSIAYYFRSILKKVAEKNNLQINGIIQRPIDNLLEYHKNKINL